MKILIIGNDSKRILTFRKELIERMKEGSNEVFLCIPFDDERELKKIKKLGIKLINIRLARTSLNPINDLKLIRDLIKSIKSIKPDLIFTFTIKPNVYGGFVSFLLKNTNSFALMVGAGSFLRTQKNFKHRFLKKIINPFLKLSYNAYSKIIFLNEDDRDLFIQLGYLNKPSHAIIGSSGVNLEYFKKVILKNTETFLFIGRLLKDKGIYEFLSAATYLKGIYPKMHFQILGGFDNNPTAIKRKELKKYEENNIIEYLGFQEDVRKYIENCYTVVLPSYHEGQGRVLVEGMAVGRPVIASDVPGCRQTVKNKINGLLIPAKNSNALADAMIYLYKNPEVGRKMGEEGFNIAKDVYDVNLINNKIMGEMNLL